MKPAKLILEVCDSTADFSNITAKDILAFQEISLESPGYKLIKAKCKKLELLNTTKHSIELGLFVVIPRPYDSVKLDSLKLKFIEKLTIARTDYSSMLKLKKAEKPN